MNRWLKYTLIGIAMAICTGYLLFATERSRQIADKRVCTNVKIVIADYDKRVLLSNNEIISLLSAKELNPIGNTVERIHTKKIEDILKRHPMVRNVECYKTPEGDVRIHVVQRMPVLRVVGDENYYVDDLRQPMPIASGHTAYVPVFTGYVPKKMAVGDIYDFAKFLNENEFWGNQIAQININSKQEVELVPRVGDHIVLLGRFERFEQKLEKLRKFYLYGLNEIGWNNYSQIDLRYKDQVVCTKKQNEL